MNTLTTIAAMSIENLDVSIALTVGGMVVSIAAAFAIVKTRVAVLESKIERISTTIKELHDKAEKHKEGEIVRIATLEANLKSHDTLLNEMKSDIKTTMGNVQDIKEAVLKLQKG